MEALAGGAGLLEEEHRLQRQPVGADERLDDIQEPRVQQEALVDRQLAVEHVDPRAVAVGEILDVSQQLVDLVRRDKLARTIRKPCSW